MNEDKINLFIATVVPEAPAPGNARFSICFELNPDHAVFDEQQDPVVIEKWKKQIMNYHQLLDKALAAPTLSINGKPIDAKLVPTGFSAGQAAEIWKDLLGFVRNGSSWQPVDKRGMVTNAGQRANTMVYIEKTKHPVLTSSWSDPTRYGVLGNFAAQFNVKDAEGKAQLKMQDFSDYIHNVIAPRNAMAGAQAAEMVTAFAHAGEQLKQRRAMQEGIGFAADAYQLAASMRKDRIEQHPGNTPFLQARMDTLLKKAAELESDFQKTAGVAAFNISTEEAAIAQNLVKAMAEADALNDLILNEPAYIRAALDELSSPLLRRFFCTIVDMEVPLESLGAGAEVFTAGVVLAAVEGFVNTSLVTMCNLKSNLAKGHIYPAEILDVSGRESTHEETLLSLRKATAFSYEQEAVVENARSAAESFASLPPVTHALVLNWKMEKIKPRTLSIAPGTEAILANMLQAKADVHSLMEVTRSVLNRVTNTVTKGHALFLTTPIEEARGDEGSGQLYLHDLVTGYAVFARKKNSTDPWQSLTEITEGLHFNNEGEVNYVTAEMGVALRVGVQSTADANGVSNGGLYKLEQSFLFSWDGTKVGAMNPMQHYEKEPQDEAARAKEFLAAQGDLPLELTAVRTKTRHVLAADWFPFKKRKNTVALVLKRKPQMGDHKVRLMFGEKYEYLMAAQLPNGYVPQKQLILAQNATLKDAIQRCKTNLPEPECTFQRHEHIGHLVVSLRNNIYADAGSTVLKKEHAGESTHELVVRTGSLLSNSSTARYILPPPIPNFQTFLWYNREQFQGANFKDKEAWEWYLRYQCELENEAGFRANLDNCRRQQDCKGCKAGCRTYCKGKTQPVVYDGKLYYLPDLIVTGFMIRFYADPDRKIRVTDISKDLYPDTFCSYAPDKYPNWRAWEFRLQRDPNPDRIENKVALDVDDRIVTVKLRAGMQLFADLIPTFNGQNASLHNSTATQGLFVERIGDNYVNTLHSNITSLTLTHASQKPVFAPVLKKTTIVRNSKSLQPEAGGLMEEGFKTAVTAQFEHLNCWRGIPMKGMLPTGELELYALWDDHSDYGAAPQKSIAEKTNNQSPSKGFVRLGAVKFGELANGKHAGKDEEAAGNNVFGYNLEELTFHNSSPLRLPYHTEMRMKLRNTSRFSSYFLQQRELNDVEKEQFSTWSEVKPLTITPGATLVAKNGVVQAPYYFNNSKPAAPEIARIIPLKVTDTFKAEVRERNNRVRFYFKPPRMMAMGKQQRMAVIIAAEETSVYQPYFTSVHAISKAGTDLLTVNPASKLKDEFIRFSQISAHNDTLFDPRLEKKLPNLVSFRPEFDQEQQLWYVDIDLDIRNERKKQPHAVFAQLNFVALQEHSSNYNLQQANDPLDFDKDNRMSQIVRADFILLNPSRHYHEHLALLRRNSDKSFTFAPDVESLYFLGSQLQTQFFALVQHRQGGFWINISSTARGDVEGPNFFHPVLPVNLRPDAVSREFKFMLDWEQRRGTFRILILEIDYYMEGKGLDHLHTEMKNAGQNGDYMPTDLPGVHHRNTFIIVESDHEDLL